MTETIAAGIGFTEGPLWVGDGAVLVTSMSRGLLYRVFLDGREPEVAAETGGGPNGLALDPGGTIVVAQNGNATMQSRSPRPVSAGIQFVRGEEVEDRVTDGCGAPNDIALGPDGLLWFTDPATPDPCVRTLDLETGRLARAVAGIAFPNGLAFGPDSDELYVADSASGDVVRIVRPGAPDEQRSVHARLPGGGPDGIAFDAHGNLYVAAFDADRVEVFDPRGERIEVIPTGERSRPTNLCFAGDDLSRLVVTLARGGRVVVAPGSYDGVSPTPPAT